MSRHKNRFVSGIFVGVEESETPLGTKATLFGGPWGGANAVVWAPFQDECRGDIPVWRIMVLGAAQMPQEGAAS